MKKRSGLFIGIVLLSSCNYLDVVPDNVATIDYAFNMRSSAETYLFTCYSWLPSHANMYSQNPSFTAGDEMWTHNLATTLFSEFIPSHIARGEQNVVEPYVDYWSGQRGGVPLWRAIRECNIFLENIGKVSDMTDYEKTRWSAEVKFLKAYYHFWLLRMYGPIPIMRENLPISAGVDEVRSIVREPVDEVFAYIVQLLDEAAADLPDVVPFEVQELGRITRPIALSMKAKALVTAASPLFNGNTNYANYKHADGRPLFNPNPDPAKWEQAVAACREAIEACHAVGMDLYYYTTGPFSNEVSDTTRTEMSIRNAVTQRWNVETIWANPNSRATAIQNHSTPALFREQPGSGCLSPTIKMAEAFYSSNGVPINEDKTWNYANRMSLRTVTPEYNLFLKEGETVPQLHFDREPRFYASLGFDGGRWYGEGRYRDTENIYVEGRQGGTASGHVYWFSITGYWPKKLVNFQNVHTSVQRSVEAYPWPVMRLADLYLLYAEALNEANGPSDEVCHYLDLIRTRAGLRGVKESWDNYSTNPGKYTSQNGLRDIIHQERTVELAFEGQRFWDLRRWKKAETVLNNPITGWDINQENPEDYYKPRVIHNQEFRSRDYFWPIREAELLVNRNLLQSPGW